jgi:hypothetical protein
MGRRSFAKTVVLVVAFVTAVVSTALTGYVALSTPDYWVEEKVSTVAAFPGGQEARTVTIAGYERPWWVYALPIFYLLMAVVLLVLVVGEVLARLKAANELRWAFPAVRPRFIWQLPVEHRVQADLPNVFRLKKGL